MFVSSGTIRLLPADGAPYPDAAPVSLISTATVTVLGTLAGAGASLDPRRFRPNILAAPSRPGESPEDDWIGRTLQLGIGESALRIHVQEKDVRRKMINIEPDSRDTRLDLLAAMVQVRRQTAGVYARVERVGTVVVGVPIFLLADDREQ